MSLLFGGSSPFASRRPKDTLTKVSKCHQFKLRKSKFKNVSRQAQELLLGLLVHDPAQRMTAREVLNIEYFTEAEDQLALEHRNLMGACKGFREWCALHGRNKSTTVESLVACTKPPCTRPVTPPIVRRFTTDNGIRLPERSSIHTQATDVFSSGPGHVQSAPPTPRRDHFASSDQTPTAPRTHQPRFPLPIPFKHTQRPTPICSEDESLEGVGRNDFHLPDIFLGGK